MMNVNETVQKIKQAGGANVRVVPMPGNNYADGDYQIEILQGSWAPVAVGLKKKMAEDVVQQALNRVILG